MSENAAPLRLSSPETEVFDAQLVQTAKLAALGELVRGAAHEINNPLLGVLGLTEFLLGEVEAGTKAHERVLLIQQSGADIKRIVQALLCFARNHPHDHGIFPLQRPAELAVELLRCTNAAKTVEIRERYTPEALHVEGSPAQLGQLFLHLLLNAQQSLSGSGEVMLELSREEAWVMATVTDTGRGLHPDVLSKAFDSFFSTKRDPAGVGLGLTACRQIARVHGGDLVLLPASGIGTSAVVRLPRAEVKAA
jgi:signal transduction histidine kinase